MIEAFFKAQRTPPGESSCAMRQRSEAGHCCPPIYRCRPCNIPAAPHTPLPFNVHLFFLFHSFQGNALFTAAAEASCGF